MRSRDGNNYRSLAICSLILFNSLVLNASEYLISYRYVVKDLILYNESLIITPAMKPCIGTPQDSIELLVDEDDNLDDTIKKNSDEFLEFIHKIGLDIRHQEITKNAQNSSTTILTLKTTC
ncbi:hypothetical protein, partial [Sulfurimonas sp.]|uniref:hypothetical protein n=1 Tax=Sulfurimonas sp. TaxID=2022749 RepID=UPI003D105126